MPSTYYGRFFEKTYNRTAQLRFYDERKIAERFTHFLNLIKLVLITKRSPKPSPVLMANIGHNKRYKTML